MITSFTNYDFANFIKSLGINFDDFHLTDVDFNHKSNVHGINHTYRVMFNCLKIGFLSNDAKNTKRAFFGAYIHDLARVNDGRCLVHGANAIKDKLYQYEDIFIKNGATKYDIEAIKLAVENHSQNFEIDKDNPHYKTVAILRDADGLDLVRINVEVDPRILRISQSRQLIDFAEELFLKTDVKHYSNFSSFLKDNL